MRWGFVHTEQVLCALVVMFLLIRYSVMTRWLTGDSFSFRGAWPVIVAFCGFVVVGLAEFAMDKPYYFWDISQDLCLIIMSAALLVIAVMEVILAQKRKIALAQHR